MIKLDDKSRIALIETIETSVDSTCKQYEEWVNKWKKEQRKALKVATEIVYKLPKVMVMYVGDTPAKVVIKAQSYKDAHLISKLLNIKMEKSHHRSDNYVKYKGKYKDVLVVLTKVKSVPKCRLVKKTIQRSTEIWEMVCE